MKIMTLRGLFGCIGLVFLLSACTASVNGSSVQSIVGATCKNANIKEENCTIGYGSDTGELKLSTDIVNLTLADNADGSPVNINLRNNANTMDYSIAVIVGPAACATSIMWGPNDAATGNVATGAGDGCTILYTDVSKAQRILQTSLNFTIAQTAYIVVSMADKENATQAVITVNATEK